MCYKTKPKIKFLSTGNKFRDFFKVVIENVWFDRFIFTCIILNTIILVLKWYDEPLSTQNIIEKFNYFFVAVFTIEAIFKIIALGLGYFKIGWNVFDFIIVIGTLAGIALSRITTDFSVGP